MGFDLLRNPDCVHLNAFGWPALLEIAVGHGWEPAGTLAPDDFPGEWDPMEYVSNDWQAVADADARALGEAFDRALSTGSFCHIEPVIRRLADFCSGGAFLIT
jgi:hypothetical protein